VFDTFLNLKAVGGAQQKLKCVLHSLPAVFRKDVDVMLLLLLLLLLLAAAPDADAGLCAVHVMSKCGAL
jgi:hypothetical protein